MNKQIVQNIHQVVEPFFNRLHLSIEKKITDSQGKVKIESTDYYYSAYNKSGKLETFHKPGLKIDISI